MRWKEILTEAPADSKAPAEPHLTRRFDFTDIGNRRFMFDPKTGKFLVGDVRGAGKGKGIRSSHAEEYFDVTGSNAGFDGWVRGWMGNGGSYRNGIIQFAPHIPDPRPESWDRYEAGWKCLEAFARNGAGAKCVVMNFGTQGDKRLGDILKPKD